MYGRRKITLTEASNIKIKKYYNRKRVMGTLDLSNHSLYKNSLNNFIQPIDENDSLNFKSDIMFQPSLKNHYNDIL